MNPVRTMITLANQPQEYEILRRLAFEISRHPDYIRNLKGRHERLAAKHTNAADAAREGEPTPPGTWSDFALRRSVRLVRTAGRAAARADWRQKRIAKLMVRGEATLKPPTDVTAEQRARALRGQV